MRRLGVLFLLLVPVISTAQDPPLKVEGDGVKVVQVDQIVVQKVDRTLVTSFPFTVVAPSGYDLYFWAYPVGVVATDLNVKLEVTAAPEGEVTVAVKMVRAKLDKDGKYLGMEVKLGRISFYVGKVAPPDPKPPDPKPPDPKPPVPTTGLRVILVAELGPTTGQPVLSKGQLNVWYSTNLKTFLDNRCVKSSDGRPEWRKWDKNIVLTGKETQTMAKLWEATKPNLNVMPAIVIVTDQTGGVYPLPETEQATIELIRQKGGV